MLLTHDVPQGNLGSSNVELPPAAAAATIQTGQGQIKPLVRFRGNDHDPQIVSASLYAFDKTNSANPFGPIVGIARWGSGLSNTHEAEFDLPANNYTQAQMITRSIVLKGGGAIISVPCSSLEVDARNDANYIPPIGDQAIGFSTISGFGSGAIGVGNRVSSPLFRTIWAVSGTAGNGLGAAASTNVNIPPFARSARVVRSGTAGIGNSLRITQATAGFTADSFVVATDALCPEFVLAGGATFLTLLNTDAVEIRKMAVIFTIVL